MAKKGTGYFPLNACLRIMLEALRQFPVAFNFSTDFLIAQSNQILQN